jgi:hemerythrin HHE cation binding domain-containing protein
MDALSLLKTDHDRMKLLLERGDDTTERARKGRREVLETVRREFQQHERMEEDVFYPALKEFAKAKDIVLEGYQEHHVVDLLLDELAHLDVADERWGAKWSVLKENVEHHIEEEEGEMFKIARSVFDKAALSDLGDRMEEVRKERSPAR